MIGDGADRSRLEELSCSLGIQDRVLFPGFLQPEKLPSWYRVADLFVLPSSHEPWGTVVIEALGAGVPIIVTDLVGSHADVINDPRIGSVVKSKRVTELADALHRQLDIPVPHKEVISIWEPVRRKMSYSTIADNMVRLLREVIGSGRGRA